MRHSDAPIRLLIVDEHPILRRGLSLAAARTGSVTVVGQADDLDSACAAVTATAPDVVLIQSTLPPAGGAALCARLKTAGVLPRLLVLDDVPDEAALLRAVEAGADGYASSEQGLQGILDAVQAVSRGEACVPRAMLGSLLSALIERRRQDEQIFARYMELTRREKEVLTLLADGCGHEAVAKILVISPQTARTHLQNIIQKLGVHSRVEAAAFAVQHNLITRTTALGRAS